MHSKGQKRDTHQSRCPFHAFFGGGSDTKNIKLAVLAEIAKPDSIIPDSKLQSQYPRDQLAKVNAMLDGIDIEPHLLVPNMFFSQITSPVVTRILEQTGRMRHSAEERYKKTSSFLFDVPRDPTSEESQHRIKVVKAMHKAAGVDPDSKDFHYGLYCFTRKMVDMLREFDTTPPTHDQELAWYNTWRQVCVQLGSTNLPTDYAKFCADNLALEKELRANVHPQNQEFAKVMFENMMNKIPAALRPIAKPLITAVMDPGLSHALNLDLGTSFEHSLVKKVLRMGSSIVALSKSLAKAIRHETALITEEAIAA